MSWQQTYMSNTYMQDVRWKNQKAIGHSICQMDMMDLQFSIGLLRVHWIQCTNRMSIGHLLFSATFHFALLLLGGKLRRGMYSYIYISILSIYLFIHTGRE
jgi:hypothetical protein